MITIPCSVNTIIQDLDSYPRPVQRVFELYYALLERDSRVSWRSWMTCFAGLLEDCGLVFVDRHDPLGTGSSYMCHIEAAYSRVPTNTGGLDRETALTVFLAWWLSYFVLPLQPAGKIHPYTFVAALHWPEERDLHWLFFCFILNTCIRASSFIKKFY